MRKLCRNTKKSFSYKFKKNIFLSHISDKIQYHEQHQGITHTRMYCTLKTESAVEQEEIKYKKKQKKVLRSSRSEHTRFRKKK